MDQLLRVMLVTLTLPLLSTPTTTATAAGHNNTPTVTGTTQEEHHHIGVKLPRPPRDDDGSLAPLCQHLPCETLQAAGRLRIPAIVSLMILHKDFTGESWAPRLVFLDEDNNECGCVDVSLSKDILVQVKYICRGAPADSALLPLAMYTTEGWIHIKLVKNDEGLNITLLKPDGRTPLKIMSLLGVLSDYVRVNNVPQFGYSKLVHYNQNTTASSPDTAASSQDTATTSSASPTTATSGNTTKTDTITQLVLTITGSLSAASCFLAIIFIIKNLWFSSAEVNPTITHEVPALTPRCPGQNSDVMIILSPQVSQTAGQRTANLGHSYGHGTTGQAAAGYSGEAQNASSHTAEGLAASLHSYASDNSLYAAVKTT
ncbi:uncharacterized protein LOC121873097 [Homarus americanus]|uniref:uncharacterized protein LOC121873097 n=1 Tax=Homarus americanus TaxID=6706 RepID=UPI001C48C77A|nr:uncharacterized protein LOC121873097 [Homarus americanus]